LAWSYSRQWHEAHLEHPLAESTLTQLTDEATHSITRQQALENAPSPPFEQYLAQFYQQYRNV